VRYNSQGTWFIPKISTVELHWLELEGTVKMCLSYRKLVTEQGINAKLTGLKNSSSDP
jgi:hypothetical protein